MNPQNYATALLLPIVQIFTKLIIILLKNILIFNIVMNKPTLLILAAGMGSRYGGLKQLDGVGPNGETIMDYSVYDAAKAGFKKVVFVVREFFRDDFEKRVRERYAGNIEIEFIEQELNSLPEGFSVPEGREKPWGTGHAVLVADSLIDTPFGVINADDYYGQTSFAVLADYLTKSEGKKGDFSMVGFCTGNTLSESGVVSRGVCLVNNTGYLTSVEEHHNIKNENDIIWGDNSKGERVIIDSNRPVSMNMWGFTPDLFKEGSNLFSEFLKEREDDLKAEFYIPFIVNELIKTNYASCRVLSTPDKWFGVTYKEDREAVAKKISELVSQGVYPTPLFV